MNGDLVEIWRLVVTLAVLPLLRFGLVTYTRAWRDCWATVTQQWHLGGCHCTGVVRRTFLLLPAVWVCSLRALWSALVRGPTPMQLSESSTRPSKPVSGAATTGHMVINLWLAGGPARLRRGPARRRERLQTKKRRSQGDKA